MTRMDCRSIATRVALRIVLATAAASPWAFASMPAAAQGAAAEATAVVAPALKDKCLGCHDDPTIKSDDGKPVAVIADDYARSAHRKLDCSTCHEAALGVKHPQNPLGAVKPQVCQECHSDEFKAIAGSIHGRRSSGEQRDQGLHVVPRQPASGAEGR